MFSKLALKNVLRSVKDYSVYFITLTFGVCIFYVFNSMDSQSVMSYLSGETRNYMREMFLRLIDVLSVFVSAVLAFLILYANSFMVRRRKKELGTYMLLGMPRRQMSGLLFLETLCIGLFALGAGLLLGVFLSQFLSVFTAGLFEIHMTEFHFVFSPAALWKTVAYFGIMFLVVMLFNSFSVSRSKLLQLIRAGRQNQDLRVKSLGSSVVMFLLGAALLGTAYTLLLRRGILQVDGIFFLMLGLGTAGTLLFFRSLSGFLLRLVQQSKKLYFKGLNMFILRQFNSKIGSTYVSMTVICLMLLLAIGITACAVGLNNTMDQLTDGKAPYDMSVYFYPQGNDAPDLEGWLAAGGFDPAQELGESVGYDICSVEVQPLTYTVGGREMTMETFSAIARSDLDALLALQGLPPLALGEGEYGLVQGTFVAEESFIKALWDDAPVLAVGGSALFAQPAAYTEAVVMTSMSYYESMLVLPDALLEGCPVDTRVLAGNYKPGADAEAEFALLQEAMHDLVPRSYVDEGTGGYGYGWETRLNTYMETMGSKILVTFLGLYLGIVFLLTSAAVLALQQLSQAADNVERYQVLTRLGVEERMRDRSVYVQVFLYFFLPLALAVVHSVVGMTAANAAIAEIGHVDAAASSIVAACFILVVYGAYFLATCWGSRRIVRGAR